MRARFCGKKDAVVEELVRVSRVVFLTGASHAGPSAAERERGLELEGVLAAEQNRAAELSTRIAFFGQAYTKVSNKLEGAEKKNKELVATLTAVQRKSDSLEKQLAGAQAQLIEAQMGGTKEVCLSFFVKAFQLNWPAI